MIIAVGVSYYNLRTGVERQSDAIIQEMSQFDQASADETLSIQYVELTPGNSLNLTIKNTGNIISQLEWIGVLDTTLNKETYYRVDASLNPLETEKDIGNTSIVMNPANTYTIQVLTRLGNIYYTEYPMPVTNGGGGGGDTETQFYYVDTESDDYSPTSLGSYSLFNALKAGPDYINSTLTEEQIVIPPTTITLIDAESFEGTWPPTGWTETGNWNQESDEVYDGTFSADFDGQGPGTSGFLYTPVLDCSDASSITVDFWYYDDNLDGFELTLWYFDGNNWDNIEDIGTVTTEDVWHNYQETITDPQYFVNDFQIVFWANDVENNEHGYIDLFTVSKEAAGADYYDMDLEASWTGLPSTTYKYLTIFGGDQDLEQLRVDYWDGGGWVNLITDVTPGYNVVDVSGILSGASFTIRFTDTIGTGDNIQSNWVIDTVYMNLFD
jgi:hypothetical protein